MTETKTINKCICEGNWRKIISEAEPLLNRKYVKDFDFSVYKFVGVMHSKDDYYYVLVSLVTGQQQQQLLSCVGSIESYEYKLFKEE